MRSDGVWRRIRWGNVARLAGLVAIAAAVAVWPRLGDDPPRLPPAEPVPLAGGAQRARVGDAGGEGERALGGERKRARAGKRARVGDAGGEGERARRERPVRGGERARERKRPREGKRARGGNPGGEGKRARGGKPGGEGKRARGGKRDGHRELPPPPERAPVVTPPPRRVGRTARVDPAAVEFGVP